MTRSFFSKAALPGTDIELPYLTVGTMMFGRRADEAESGRIVDLALDRGLNFFDTANAYNGGASEEILGRLMKGRRDRCLVATKVGLAKRSGEREGLAAKTIEAAIDESLMRLQMDHVDLYYLHQPDYETPIEESLEALNRVVESGKVRYPAISNYGAFQSLEIIQYCRANGWAVPVMTQMIYNPMMRQIELEYMRFCRKYGLLLTVYNPLAGGLLTGKYASLADKDRGGRFQTDAGYQSRYWTKRYLDGMLSLKAIADDAGVGLTHLALCWVRRQSAVGNILLGPSSTAQLEDCLEAEMARETVTDDVWSRVDECLTEFEGTSGIYAR